VVNDGVLRRNVLLRQPLSTLLCESFSGLELETTPKDCFALNNPPNSCLDLAKSCIKKDIIIQTIQNTYQTNKLISQPDIFSTVQLDEKSLLGFGTQKPRCYLNQYNIRESITFHIIDQKIPSTKVVTVLKKSGRTGNWVFVGISDQDIQWKY
jgi:hypothetical protein